MKRIIFLLIVVFISSCGGGGSSSGGSSSLFKLWTNVDTGATLDLRNVAFSVPILFSLFVPNGAQCSCILRIIGNNSSGSHVLNSCTFVQGTGPNPGCRQFNDTGRYTNTGGTLTLVSNTGGGTTTFR